MHPSIWRGVCRFHLKAACRRQCLQKAFKKEADVELSPFLGYAAVQVLVEQCRRLGIDVEASSAHIAHMEQVSRGTGAGGTSTGRKPGGNLDISAIHARIKQVLPLHAALHAASAVSLHGLAPGKRRIPCCAVAVCHMVTSQVK